MSGGVDGGPTTRSQAWWYNAPQGEPRPDRRSVIQRTKMPWDDILRDIRYMVQGKANRMKKGNSYNRRWQWRHQNRRWVKKLLGINKMESALRGVREALEAPE